MIGFSALYLFLLASVAGYALIARVPSILHMPLMSGSNFIHGIVLVGAILAMGHADGALQNTIGFLAVVAASANAVGGFVVTDRMLAMFEAAQQKKTLATNTIAEEHNDTDTVIEESTDDDGSAS